MIYLYIKQHNVTKLKYLGKTTQSDPHKYRGSGLYWAKHIKKHGYDVTTTILLETKSKWQIKDCGLFFSKLFNVVKSKEWANFREESGDGVSSNDARIENYKRVSNGTHQFSGPSNNIKTQHLRNETRRKNGTHNFLGGKLQRDRIANGTHHFLNGDIQRKTNKKLLDAGIFPAQLNICLVDIKGKVWFVPKETYIKNDHTLVHINSIEGKIRMGKKIKRKINEYWK